MKKISLKDPWELAHPVQCAKCPWKVTTNPYDIPNNYSLQKHQDLECTIAQDLSITDQIKVMACHEAHEEYCIGWLNNQLINNNISLRIQMLSCTNAEDIQVIGEQHAKFEDTLPNNK
ncbi:MAG: hypothetical protein RLZZ499_2620 [Cyanobacteriota bacterium]|jgi:hypothetical protein